MKKFICILLVAVIMLEGCSSAQEAESEVLEPENSVSTVSTVSSSQSIPSSSSEQPSSSEPESLEDISNQIDMSSSSIQVSSLASSSESLSVPSESIILIEPSSTPNSAAYQAIYNEYSAKLQKATPGLIEELKRESEGLTGKTNQLAEISAAKIIKLLTVFIEGTDKMYDIMESNGGDRSEYDRWAGKLNTVYLEESNKIFEVYMKEALGESISR